MWTIVAVGAGTLLAPAVLASWWCDSLFGRTYMNRANILYPNGRASRYWEHCDCFFFVVEIVVLGLALLGSTLPPS